MFIFIGGVLYSLDPPNAYLWGGPDPPGNRRACWRSPVFWLKNRLNSQIWPKNPPQFRKNRVILIQQE